MGPCDDERRAATDRVRLVVVGAIGVGVAGAVVVGVGVGVAGAVVVGAIGVGVGVAGAVVVGGAIVVGVVSASASGSLAI